ncbi:DUF11 domain-containing protein, partial [Candidatus Gribaldobacteria bacterium]|nr:DUF11 domain-containing protein [Candidatus Gribaldobacteria bacterium]
VAYGSKTTTRTIISLNSFTESLAGLSQCSVYHFRAVAQNESEKSYGQDRVFTTLCQTQVKISVLTQNLSQGGPYAEKTTIQEGDTFSTKIIIESTGSSMAKNVSLKVVLPPNTIYNNNLIIAGLADGRDITSQVISLGDLAPKESKTISFQARVDKAVNLPTGLNTLIGTILVYTTESANSASFTLFQSGTGAGAASNVGQPTNVNTGIVSDLAYSVLLPLIMALGIVYLFRSKLLGLDKVLSERKLKVDDFRANKQLKKAIRKRIKQ